VYWLVHDDVTGKVRTARPVAGVMLAAGVCAELAAAGHVCVLAGRLVVHVPVAAVDPLHVEVLGQLLAEDERHRVRLWLDHLSDTMADRIAGRMVSAELAQQARTFRGGVQVTANPSDQGPAWVRAGLIDAMRRGDALDANQLFLVGLAQHSNMYEHPFSDVNELQARYALSQLSGLPDSWQQLVAAAADLIRTAALTR
jgi:hypothetical protein